MTALITILMSIMTFAQVVVPQETKKETPTKSDVLAAIDRFLANPGPGDDAQCINQFAQESPDCMVGISENVLPWTKLQPAPKYSGGLLTAFVAGNVKAQLESGKNADHPYAGLLAVFKVYDKLRERDKEFKIAEIDELIAKEKNGELKAWVEKAAKEAAAEHDKGSGGK